MLKKKKIKMFINCSHKNIIENAYLHYIFFSFLRVCTYTILIKLIKVVKRENCEFCSIKNFDFNNPKFLENIAYIFLKLL